TVEVGTRARDGAPSEERRGGRSSVPSTERYAESRDCRGAKLLRVEARRSGGAPPVEPSQDSRSGRPRDTRAGVPPRSRTAHQRARREDRTDSARARVAAVVRSGLTRSLWREPSAERRIESCAGCFVSSLRWL